jgi:hypothetical protein
LELVLQWDLPELQVLLQYLGQLVVFALVAPAQQVLQPELLALELLVQRVLQLEQVQQEQPVQEILA